MKVTRMHNDKCVVVKRKVFCNDLSQVWNGPETLDMPNLKNPSDIDRIIRCNLGLTRHSMNTFDSLDLLYKKHYRGIPGAIRYGKNSNGDEFAVISVEVGDLILYNNEIYMCLSIGWDKLQGADKHSWNEKIVDYIMNGGAVHDER